MNRDRNGLTVVLPHPSGPVTSAEFDSPASDVREISSLIWLNSAGWPTNVVWSLRRRCFKNRIAESIWVVAISIEFVQKIQTIISACFNWQRILARKLRRERGYVWATNVSCKSASFVLIRIAHTYTYNALCGERDIEGERRQSVKCQVLESVIRNWIQLYLRWAGRLYVASCFRSLNY